ncbi:MAG: glycosyltransferase family 4 protein, partial [Bacteroidota bacterium]
IDERSVKGSAWRTVPDGVYRESMLQTAVVAHLIEYHRKRGTWDRVPDLLIVLTEFAKAKLVEGGIPEEKMVVKPNFTEDPFKTVLEGTPNSDLRDHSAFGDPSRKPVFLYVGRISPEKGVEDLIEAWKRRNPEATLRLVGDGPLRASLQKSSVHCPDIEWRGAVVHEEVLREMACARALLFPSRWYEGFPMTLVESFACGCPIIATDIGSQGSIVREGETGLKVPAGDPDAIVEKVQRLIENPELAHRMGEKARHTYESNYSPIRNLERLEVIYEEAVERSRS